MKNEFDTSLLIDKIEMLCRQAGITRTKMFDECGLNRHTYNNIKSGSIPSVDKIAIIADYFHVSVDYLLGRTESTSNIIQTGDITGNNNIAGNSGDVTIGTKMSGAEETAQEINTILSVLTPRERTELMMMIYQFADEHSA